MREAVVEVEAEVEAKLRVASPGYLERTEPS